MSTLIRKEITVSAIDAAPAQILIEVLDGAGTLAGTLRRGGGGGNLEGLLSISSTTGKSMLLDGEDWDFLKVGNRKLKFIDVCVSQEVVVCSLISKVVILSLEMKLFQTMLSLLVPYERVGIAKWSQGQSTRDATLVYCISPET